MIRFSAILLTLILTLSTLQAIAADSRCPLEPKVARAMINELKDAIECASLSPTACRNMRDGKVGGAIGAQMAAGLAALKRQPGMMSCLIGATAPAAKSWAVFDTILDPVLGPFAWAGASCGIDRAHFLEQVKSLQSSYQSEIAKARAELLENMIQHRMGPQEATKTTTSEIRDKMVSAYDRLSADLKGASGKTLVPDESRRLQLLDVIKMNRENILRPATTISDLMQATDSVFYRLPDEARKNLAGVGIDYFSAVEQTRLSKVEKVDSKLAQTIAAELDEVMASRDPEIIKSYLSQKGYSQAAIKAIVAATEQIQGITTQLHQTYGLSRDLVAGKLSTAARLSADNVRELAKKHLPSLETHLLRHFSPVPGVTASMANQLMRAGRSALTRATELASRASKSLAPRIVGTAGTVLAAGGKAIAAPVTMGVEYLGLHTSSIGCPPQGRPSSAYANWEEIEDVCQVVPQRTPMFDAFLFALTDEEQMTALRGTGDVCEMLVGIHDASAPSGQWAVHCEVGGDVILTGKSSLSEGQTFRFSGTTTSPSAVSWTSEKTNQCGLSTTDGEAVTSDVRSWSKNGGRCDAGQTILGRAPSKREAGIAGRARAELSDWVRSNSYTLSAGRDCCSGKPNPLCLNASTSSSNPGLRGGADSDF